MVIEKVKFLLKRKSLIYMFNNSFPNQHFVVKKIGPFIFVRFSLQIKKSFILFINFLFKKLNAQNKSFTHWQTENAKI